MPTHDFLQLLVWAAMGACSLACGGQAADASSTTLGSGGTASNVSIFSGGTLSGGAPGAGGGTDSNLARCNQLNVDYRAAEVQATSCEPGLSSLQCQMLRAVGLAGQCGGCEIVLNERQIEALATLAEIEATWAQLACASYQPRLLCGMCATQLVTSMMGGCSDAGKCLSVEPM